MTALEGKPSTVDSDMSGLKTKTASMSVLTDPNTNQPTVRFTGVNVQIVSGSGSTNGSVNGRGNLILGYDEQDLINGYGDERTGSHNLVLGTSQDYTSFGGIVAGSNNRIAAPYASITGGYKNGATDQYTSVNGGIMNVASSYCASISGGSTNLARANFATVSGGGGCVASGYRSSVSGGRNNTASDTYSSVSGGEGIVMDKFAGWGAGTETYFGVGNGGRGYGYYSTY